MPLMTITLVHGTFARDASWTKKGSPMWQALETELGDDVVLDRFDWSGMNDVMDRWKAGWELADHLQELQQRYSGSCQYVVAHSHGGNVALYAAREHHIAGIACLATPFLHAAPRNSVAGSSKAALRGVQGLGTAALLLWAAITEPSTWVVAASVVGWVVLSKLLGAVLQTLIFGLFAVDLPKYRANVTARVPEGTSLMIARSAGDEASLALSMSQFLGWFTSFVYARLMASDPMQFFRRPLRRLTVARVIVVLISAAVALTAFLVAGDFREMGAGYRVLLVCCFYLSAAVATRILDSQLEGLAYIALLLANVIEMVAVGSVSKRARPEYEMPGWASLWNSFSFAISTAIYTESAPTGGPWGIRQFPRTDIKLEEGELTHSIYNNPAVVEATVEWLKGLSRGQKELEFRRRMKGMQRRLDAVEEHLRGKMSVWLPSKPDENGA